MSDSISSNHPAIRLAPCNSVVSPASLPLSPPTKITSDSNQRQCRRCCYSPNIILFFTVLTFFTSFGKSYTALSPFIRPNKNIFWQIDDAVRNNIISYGSSSNTSLSMAPMTYEASRQSNDMSSFQRRMRKLVLPEKKPKKNSRRRGRPENFKVVETLEEYKKVVGHEDEKLVVVRFYAPWCKACKAIAPLFYRLAATYPDVIFVDVPVTSTNADLHQGLGVPSLPYGHIYHPSGGLVEEVKISRKYFPAFANGLKTYVNGLCEIHDDHEEQPISREQDEESEMRTLWT